MKAFWGVWQGTGLATYPTIEATPYREELTFVDHGRDSVVRVEQRTWQIHPDNSETLLHWEYGFIRPLEDGTYQWNNAQSNGRVEVLVGTVAENEDGWVLDLRSVAFANDPRMLQTTRRFTVQGDQLRYTMTMATQEHPDRAVHLEATLARDSAS